MLSYQCTEGLPVGSRSSIANDYATARDLQQDDRSLLRSVNEVGITGMSPNGTYLTGFAFEYDAQTSAWATMRFALPAAVDVRLELYDLLGRPVMVPLEGLRAAGSHEVVIETYRLPVGIYLVRLTAGKESATKRIMVVR